MLAPLLESLLVLSDDLEVERTLERIVETAREVTRARYGACGVPGETGFLHFVHRGMDAAETEKIGAPPMHVGLLGTLLHGSESIRIDRLHEHAESSGYPSGHAPMSTFLGVPIQHQARTIGSIYLTEKADGLPFTEEDQAAVEVLARFAGIALANAYEHLGTSEELQERSNELEAANTKLRDLSGRVMSMLETERRVVAQELHDGIGQLLAGAILGINAWKSGQTDPDTAFEMLESVMREAVGEVRRISHGLRPAVLDELGPEAAIRTVVKQMSPEWADRFSLQIHGARRRIHEDVETTLFRIAQESLTNVVRHSGANEVVVDIEYLAESVRMMVRDDGVGIDPAAGGDGIGITGMRERALLVNGTLSIESAPGKGTTVTFEAPAEAR